MRWRAKRRYASREAMKRGKVGAAIDALPFLRRADAVPVTVAHYAAEHFVDRTQPGLTGEARQAAILDKFEQIAKTYGVAGSGGDGNETTALPRTFLVDQMGKVRAIYREEGADLETVIEADLEASKTAVRPASADGNK